MSQIPLIHFIRDSIAFCLSIASSEVMEVVLLRRLTPGRAGGGEGLVVIVVTPNANGIFSSMM